MPAADGASFTRIVGRAFVRDTRQLLIHSIIVVSLDRGGNAKYYTHERAQLLGMSQPSTDEEPPPSRAPARCSVVAYTEQSCSAG